MRKYLFLTSCLLLHSACSLFAQSVYNPNKCGMQIVKEAMIANDPAWTQRFEDQRNSLQGIADEWKSRQRAEHPAGKTTSVPTIPVIFHVLVTYSEYITLGGNAGIAQRIDAQIAVLNQDFNKQNADSNLIPLNWKPLYANVGIHFGLAHTDPNGFGTPGYTISIIPDVPGGFSGATNSYRVAKYDSTGGSTAWDVSRYMNVWCINPVDVSGLLGLTVAKSFTYTSAYPVNEMGICINWATLGKRVSSTDYYIPGATAGDYYDQGRTLTHETGHFFEIWHTWGDDNGRCPWQMPYKDDGLTDTPPEAMAKFDNTPYTISGGTYYDTCRFNGSIDSQKNLGCPCLDYMNYTDDVGMLLFTPDQAAVMDAMALTAPGSGGHGMNGSGIVGESYSLTQNPSLLNWSTRTGVAPLEAEKGLAISPNPSKGIINVSFNSSQEQLTDISILNMFGLEVAHKNTWGSATDYFSFDLSGMSKGIYLVRCNFVSGNITRKILLQ